MWRTIAERTSVTDRDRYWDHPDLLPDADALSDPEAFLTATASSGTDDWDISTLDDPGPERGDPDGSEPGA